MHTPRFTPLLVAAAASIVVVATASDSADHIDHAGTFVLTVLTADPGAFGYAADVPNQFVGTFLLVLDPPHPPEPIPDGDYEASFTSFELTIGDTSWDATMPHDAPLVRFEGGLPIGWVSTLTETRPEHPDLLFTLPNSPGTFEAIDDDGVSNDGSIAGTYELVVQSAAAPALGPRATIVTAVLLVGAVAMVLARRRIHTA